MNTPTRNAIRGDGIFTVHDFCTADECAELLRLAHGIGFTAAPITTGRGFVMAPEVRNNTRVILDDEARAARLWQRLAPFVPERQDRWRAVGLNERFRFYRYEPGQYFRWHRDGSYFRDTREHSLLTFMIYLDAEFTGGSTDFDPDGEVLRVTPARGMALLFEHPIRHQGAPVLRGVKHVLRSDVMYRRDAA
ncbi:2OG-Fe(II) oxygenase family protein [Nannocystis radixulma]|uniref:2OG-Fe(II) oxygenase n=1 Tax=Nannocystis radixulma TaxID=2995305 RepID=A0ABT5B4Q7_9BACT|nr:2OG-Fe(II) oxygenase [Nannocystis radixulma]MDC0669076.1 2OG-Fe(II) oxygenase [Nannocystis radixulma]